MEMHARTFDAIQVNPLSLIFGHLQGLPYWPMDSQFLTYLGSFGAPFLILFLSLHLYWTIRAWRKRNNDNGFAVVSFFVFGFIFAINRILDYFPVAIIYFILVSNALKECPKTSNARYREALTSCGVSNTQVIVSGRFRSAVGNLANPES
jgi:hypothetical protein